MTSVVCQVSRRLMSQRGFEPRGGGNDISATVAPPVRHLRAKRVKSGVWKRREREHRTVRPLVSRGEDADLIISRAVLLKCV